MSFAQGLDELNAAELADYGQPATLTVGGVYGYALSGIFKPRGALENGQGSVAVRREVDGIDLPTASLAGIEFAIGDTVTTVGKTYAIAFVGSDVYGMTALDLREIDDNC